MRNKTELEMAIKIQSAIRGFVSRRKYAIHQLPTAKLENYSVLIQGNDPDNLKLPRHKADETVVLIGTSGMRSAEIACQLSRGSTKLIILDNSKQVAEFWKIARTIISKTNSSDDFLAQLKNFVLSTRCNGNRGTDVEFAYLERLFKQYGFDKLKKIIANAIIISQSWGDKATLTSIKNALEYLQIKNIYAYVSNIVAYVDSSSKPEAEQVMQNIEILNPKIAIHSDLINGLYPENFFLVTNHSPLEVKKQLFNPNQTHGLNDVISFFNLIEKISQKPNQTSQKTTNQVTSSSLKGGFFNKPDELGPLLKKYNLADDSQTNLEKGLRNAVTNNYLVDVEVFIKHVKNINAQDKNINSQRTALHWAAIKNHEALYKTLIKAGSSKNIKDANGKTPEDYRNALLKTRMIEFLSQQQLKI